MRVLVLTDLYPPAATGGYERSCADVVDRWRRAGHAVTVLTTRRPGDPPDLHDTALRDLPFVAGPDADAAQQRAARAVVGTVLADHRADVVSAWNLARVPQRGVLEAVTAAGVPLVFVACDGWLADAPPDLTPPPAGSHVVWVSDQLRAATRTPRWLPEAQSVVGSGIDAGTFTSQPREAQPWRGRLLFVGRLSPAKGADDAVSALRHLPPGTRLDVVGPGTPERRAELAALAARLDVGARVGFATADRAELPAVYAAADALVFPSRWAEPFGLVPLEAMASSLPVIATGTGGSASYLQDGVNALLVPPGEPAAIAAAVARLAGDATLRAGLVRHGLITSRAHGIDAVADALAGVHRRAVSAAQ